MHQTPVPGRHRPALTGETINMTVMAVEKPEHTRSLDRFMPQRHQTATQASSWLAALQQAAADRFLQVGFPTTQHEEWRLTNVTPLIERSYGSCQREEALALAHDPAVVAALKALELSDAHAVRLVLINGYFVPELSSAAPAGVTVRGFSEVIKTGEPAIRSLLGKLALPEHHGFVALNAAAFSDGLFIDVTPGCTLLQPLHIIALTHHADHHVGVLAHPRLLVNLGHHAKLTVLTSWVGGGAAPSLTNPVMEAFVGPSSALELIKVVNIHDADSHIASDYVHLADAATLRSFVLNMGGAVVRNNLSTVLDGPAAEATLNGLSLSRGRQHVDNQTMLDHAREHCPSHELYKSILADQATGVFKGRILVRPGAQKTDSKQTSKAILLSDEATMNSQPQLEIYADDVKCTHGSTTGPLDDEQLFYLRSRGLDATRAHAFLTYAFAADAINRISHEAVRTAVNEKVVERLHEVAPG